MPKLKHLSKLLTAFGLLSINNSFVEQVHVFKIGQGDSVLEYRISLAKDSFLPYEVIDAQVWAKNVSSIPLQCTLIHLFDFWNISDSNEKTYPKPYISHRSKYAPFVKPQDSTGGIMGIGYGIRDSLNHTIPTFLPTGQYSARHPRDTLPFIFYVVEHAGEEAEALTQYLNSYSPTKMEIFIRFSKPVQRESLLKEKAKNLFYFSEKFPNSSYAPQALLEANWMADVGMQHEIIQRLSDYPFPKREYIFLKLTQAFLGASLEAQLKIIQIFLDQYPESALNLKTQYNSDLFDFLHRSLNFQLYRAELERIIKTNKNKKIIEAAKEALKKVRTE